VGVKRAAAMGWSRRAAHSVRLAAGSATAATCSALVGVRRDRQLLRVANGGSSAASSTVSLTALGQSKAARSARLDLGVSRGRWHGVSYRACDQGPRSSVVLR